MPASVCSAADARRSARVAHSRPPAERWSRLWRDDLCIRPALRENCGCHCVEARRRDHRESRTALSEIVETRQCAPRSQTRAWNVNAGGCAKRRRRLRTADRRDSQPIDRAWNDREFSRASTRLPTRHGWRATFGRARSPTESIANRATGPEAAEEHAAARSRMTLSWR